MNPGPLLPTSENIARFRAELANASEAELIAQEAKDPNMAPGIAARQLLAEIQAKRFRVTTIIGITGVVLSAAAAWFAFQSVPQQPQYSASVPKPPQSAPSAALMSASSSKPQTQSVPAAAVELPKAAASSR